MKSKHLIPIITIGCATSAVTPLIVSCGGNWDAQWDYVNQGEYPTRVQRAKSDVPLTLGAATQRYFDDISKDNYIFINDFLVFGNFEYQIGTTLGDVKTLTLCLSLDNVDPINHTLSVSFDLLMTAEVDSLYTNEKMLYTIEKYFVFKNIEWETVFQSYPSNDKDGFWGLKTSAGGTDDLGEILSILDRQETWSISGKIGQTEDDGKIEWKTLDFNQDKKPTTEDDTHLIMNALGTEIILDYLGDIKPDLD